MDDARPIAPRAPEQGARPPVKARPSRVRRAMRPEEAFRLILSDCLAQLNANAALLRTGRSVEGLHQLRVALRRLEVALKIFGKEFGQEWLKELRRRAKSFTARLGHARDLDVFLTGLLDAPMEPHEGEMFLNLRARLEEMRDRAWAEACGCVRGDDFALFAEEVAGLAHSRLPLAHDYKFPRVAKKLLDRQERHARKRGKKARDGDEAHLHRLRVALKRLRYTAEFLGPLYPRRKVKHYVHCLRGLQEQLGRVNDLTHARGAIARLLKEGEASADERYAAGLVAGWCRARRPEIAMKALKKWKKFRKRKPFWA